MAVNRQGPQQMWPQGVRVALVGGEKHIGHVYAERGSGECAGADADAEGTGGQSDSAASAVLSTGTVSWALSILCRFLPLALELGPAVGDAVRL